MVWKQIKQLLRKDRQEREQQIPDIGWLDPAKNPWPVPVLDVRPVTLNMLSVSQNPQNATNAVSFSQDDGTSFIGIQPPMSRTVSADLRFRIDRVLADGALFVPDEMEHKWALYYHGGQILCIRSWRREVQAMAECHPEGEYLRITSIRGTLVTDEEDPEFTVRVLDYLIRSHALDMVYPAPLLAELAEDPKTAALCCMMCFGNRAMFATPHQLNSPCPDRPLRTYSLLHIAVARGDTDRTKALLDQGVPIDILDRDGLAPLHWSLARTDTSMANLLLDRGSPVDVRSAEGATTLMNAVQDGSVEKTAFLLDRGADPNAKDARGFTALHRAAEMGRTELAEMLLQRGAAPNPEAAEHTPRSLAEQRGETAILKILDHWRDGTP